MEGAQPPPYSQHLWETLTTLVFLPADRQASWSLLSSSVYLLSDTTEQPENTYSCILRVTGQKRIKPEKAKKG